MKFKLLIIVLLALCVTLNAQIVSTNGIATDSATGLVWQDNSEAKTYQKDWNGAKAYCESLTLDGYEDWRLPNIYELSTLLDNTKSKEPYVLDGIKYINSFYYWSSSNAEDTSRGRLVGFSYGDEGTYGKTNYSAVRCVRSKQLNFDNLVILKNKGKVKISQENINEISPKKDQERFSKQSNSSQNNSSNYQRATVTFFQEQDYKAPVGGTQFYSVGCSDGTGGVVSLTEVGKNYGSICGSNTQKGFNQCKPKNSWSLSLSAQALCEN